MSRINSKELEILFEIFENLPREGPGDSESTRKAYSLLKNLPFNPKILDLGCGSGAQTVELAKISEGNIQALDINQEFLDRLNKKAKKEGVFERITTIKSSMLSMDFEDNIFDIIWAEGSIYIIGFEKGLKEIKQFLKPKGYVVVSELSWLRKDRPEEARNFFQAEYPAMQSIKQNIEVIDSLGYLLINHFILPKSAWWENYYIPLEKRVKFLRKKYEKASEINKLLDSTQKEIDLFRKYSDYYGYVFYIMQNK